MTVWQVATGEAGRDYRELFFDHDLMILGPIVFGEAQDGRYAVGKANSPVRQVDNFARGPMPGDRVLMRFGREVIGVGEIPNGEEHQYRFDRTFRSVYGWDLCHLRRVKWAPGVELGDLATVYHKAKQKPSFTQVREPEIVAMVKAFDFSDFATPLKDLPEVNTEEYTDEELGRKLFRAGVSNRNVEDILAALRQAERLIGWYQDDSSGRKPREYEVVSHIVLPLFLGLGWSHQQIAVEWHSVDVSFFKRTPTTEENCLMVLEAKGLGQGLGEVLAQPRGYVRSLRLQGVRYILTTDGDSLFVYERPGEDWNPEPVGYLRVTSLQKGYVLPRDTDLVETLVSLQPNTV